MLVGFIFEGSKVTKYRPVNPSSKLYLIYYAMSMKSLANNLWIIMMQCLLIFLIYPYIVYK